MNVEKDIYREAGSDLKAKPERSPSWFLPLTILVFFPYLDFFF